MPNIKPVRIPFFSIVTCTYNRANIICRALDSLLSQTCDDWECIIVDDGSTDNTKAVVAPYLGKGFRYIHRAHQGCAPSKNAGMQAARGRYVTFLDSDDEYGPDHLAIRKEILEKAPDIDLLYGDVTVVGNPYVPDRDDPKMMVAIKDCVVGGSFVIKRDALAPSLHFKNTYSGDSRFFDDFMASGKKTKKISSPTYIYHRDSPDSMCDDVG